jgi:hypothetical protein
MAAGIPAKSYHVLLSAKMSTEMKEGGSLFPELIKGLAKPNGTARFIEVATDKASQFIIPIKSICQKTSVVMNNNVFLNSTERLKQ